MLIQTIFWFKFIDGNYIGYKLFKNAKTSFLAVSLLLIDIIAFFWLPPI